MKKYILPVLAALLLAGCVEGNPALPDPGITVDPASIIIPTPTTPTPAADNP